MGSTRKKRIFIGSSSETKELAKKIKEQLVANCDCVVWYDDFFELGNYVFNDLIQKAISFDYAILIGGEDDKVIRLQTNDEKLSPRDNIYLEYGMFSGILSTNRILFLVHRNCKVASDLTGMTLAEYGSAEEAVEKAQKWSTNVLAGKRTRVFSALDIGLLPTVGIAVGYFHNFLSPLVDIIRKTNTFTYEGTAYPLSNKKLIISIPSYIDEVPEYTQSLIAAEQLVEVTLKYRFLINPKDLESGNLFIHDVPGTLRAVFETIAYIFDLKDSETEDSRFAKYRALDNFYDTLSRILEDKKAVSRFVELRRFDPYSEI